jgi:transposase
LEEFVLCLVQGESSKDIQKRFGIADSTFYRWTRDEEVITKLQEYAKSSKEHSIRLLEGRTEELLNRMDKLSGQDNDKRVAYNATVWLLEQIIGKATTRIAKEDTEVEESRDKSLSDIIDISRFKQAN